MHGQEPGTPRRIHRHAVTDGMTGTTTAPLQEGLDESRQRERLGSMTLDERGVPLPDPSSTSALIPASYIGTWLARQSPLVRGRLLDLGAGNQPYRVWYNRLVDASIAVDMTPSPGLAAICSANRLPIKDQSVDVVLATEVLEHVADVEAAVAEVHRVLRPGGHLLATVPFIYPIHEAPFDFWRFTEHGLRSLCERHRFDVVDLGAKGGLGMLGAHIVTNGLPRVLDRLAASLGQRPLSERPAVRRMLTAPQVRLMERQGERTGLGGSAGLVSIGYLLAAERR